VPAARVVVTGASGLVGPRVVTAAREAGAEVTVLSRDPARAARKLGDVHAIAWEPLAEPAPAQALTGADAVVHLAGEPVAQRWSAAAKRAIRDSRVIGTRNLVEGLAATGQRPGVLVCSSAIGYYGARGEEPLDEDAPPSNDFLARVCVEWEAEALRASQLGVRSVQMRTGVVLDGAGGALAKMLPPFRLGLGGPVAGGDQYVSWILLEDLVGLVLAAADGEQWSGPVNATAPEPVTNGELSQALGRALGRPTFVAVPAFALRALYGEMARIITTGARVVPAKALVLGYRFRHPGFEPALEVALGQE
jgi:uncharacterized protein (TIGR01777 family)